MGNIKTVQLFEPPKLVKCVFYRLVRYLNLINWKVLTRDITATLPAVSFLSAVSSYPSVAEMYIKYTYINQRKLI